MLILNKHTHALHYLSAIQEIARPLISLGIIHFKFTLFLSDGKRVTFCNDPDWLIHFYNQSFYLIGDFDINPHLVKEGTYIWDHLPSSSISPVACSARDDYHFSHGLSVVQHHPDGVYRYDFATKNDNGAINNFYLHFLDCIEQFILYFSDKAQPLIHKALKNPLKTQERPTVFNQRNLYPEFDKEDFLQSINIKHFYLTGHNTSHYLTPKELECFRLLNKGFSQKQIADSLKLSKRTVEYYLRLAKERCDCDTLQALQFKVQERLMA